MLLNTASTVFLCRLLVAPKQKNRGNTPVFNRNSARLSSLVVEKREMESSQVRGSRSALSFLASLVWTVATAHHTAIVARSDAYSQSHLLGRDPSQ